MKLVLSFALVLLLSQHATNGLSIDENFVGAENLTLLDIFVKQMELSDYKIPEVSVAEKG